MVQLLTSESIGVTVQPYGVGGGGDMVSQLVNAETPVTTTATLAVGIMHRCSGTTSDYTVTLPSAASSTGKMVGVRIDPACTKYITVKGNASELIDGLNTRIMWKNETCILLSDGSSWTKIAGKTVPMVGKIYNTASQTFAAATATKVVCDGSDAGNLHDLANKRIVLVRPSKGILMMDSLVNNTNTSATYVELRVYTNTVWTDAVRIGYIASQFCNPFGQKVKTYAAGDIFEMYVYYSVGSFTTSVLLANSSFLTYLEIPEW